MRAGPLLTGCEGLVISGAQRDLTAAQVQLVSQHTIDGIGASRIAATLFFFGE